MKSVYLRKNSKLIVLNMGYKLDLLQPKGEVFWHFKYSRSETSNAWKIPLEVMKFVYLNPTKVLSVLIIGLNLSCTILCILWICTQPTSYLYNPSKQDMTRSKWWNTCIASQHLGTFIKTVLDEEKPSRKGYGYDTLQPGQVLSSSHFCHQAPPHMQCRRKS